MSGVILSSGETVIKKKKSGPSVTGFTTLVKAYRQGKYNSLEIKIRKKKQPGTGAGIPRFGRKISRKPLSPEQTWRWIPQKCPEWPAEEMSWMTRNYVPLS